MKKTTAIWPILCCAIGLHTSPAAAQYPAPYYGSTYNRPTVSPYVNLGYTPNGLSNYQTLVRPMIDDQAAIMRDSEALQQLKQQMRGRPDLRDARDANQRDADGRPRGGARMYYSHYFNGLR